MVNLKVLNLDFNSIKVRLEPQLRAAGLNPLLSFQFHKGTIRTESVQVKSLILR